MRSLFVLPSLLGATLLMIGCSGMVDSTHMSGITIPEPAGTGTSRLAGEVYGGQAPLVGSHVYAFSSSVIGNGGPGIATSTSNASLSLIAATPYVTGYQPVADGTGKYYVPTDGSGFYEISSSTPCTPGSITYLYSVQGNGGTGNNTAAGEMVALGVCPAGGTLAGSLKAGTQHIHMNEVSTIAAAYALAGFATDAIHIGAATTTGGTVTDTLAQTGIQNAVLNAAQMYNYNYSGDVGAVANATTPGGNGTVPQKTIDSLGNSLSLCVGQIATSTGCTGLLTNIKSAGTTGTTATDTATIAIYIAQNPAANVATIYTNSSSSGNAGFSPFLTAQPNDWSLTIVFTGGGLGVYTYEQPKAAAVDASGNVWVVNFGSNTVSEFTPLGVAASGTPYSTGAGPFSVAIDGSGNAWTANFSASNLTKVGPLGASPTTYTPALSGPTDAEFDGSGNIFVSNCNSSKISKLNSSAVLQGSTTASADGQSCVYSVALEAGTAGAAWATNDGDQFITYLSNAPAATADKNCYAALTSAGYTTMTNGVAIDSTGNAWYTYLDNTDPYDGYLCKDTTGNTSTRETTPNAPYVNFPVAVAIDGNNNVWITDNDNGVIDEFSSTAAELSGTYGFIVIGNSAYTSSSATIVNEPDGLALDGSGNVWYTAQKTGTTDTTPTLNEIIGIAVPTYGPLSQAVKNSKLGARP